MWEEVILKSYTTVSGLGNTDKSKKKNRHHVIVQVTDIRCVNYKLDMMWKTNPPPLKTNQILHNTCISLPYLCKCTTLRKSISLQRRGPTDSIVLTVSNRYIPAESILSYVQVQLFCLLSKNQWKVVFDCSDNSS